MTIWNMSFWQIRQYIESGIPFWVYIVTLFSLVGIGLLFHLFD